MSNAKTLRKKENRSVRDKREKEKVVVAKMIALYCHGKRHGAASLCPSCEILSNYALMRVDCCPYMEDKSFCSNCRSPCYNSEMRRQIKEVMRYSGPRMLLHNPILALRHLYEMRKEASNRKT